MPRHQLRIIRIVPTVAATYGGGTYSTTTYGERAADPADLQRYELVPVDHAVGGLDPVLIYRRGDQAPTFRFKLIAFGGPYEEVPGSFIDVDAIDQCNLVLTRMSSGPPTVFMILCSTQDDDDLDIIEARLTADDLAEPGTYRVSALVYFDSGRKLSAPANDRFTIQVNDSEVA